MISPDLDVVRDRLAAAITENELLRQHQEVLLREAEVYVLLDWIENELLPDYWSIPEDSASKLDAARDAERSSLLLEWMPIGSSRFGGLPDLPPEIAWPEWQGRKLRFLAQINFADMPHWEESLLPEDGWLYVFGRGQLDDWSVVVRYHRGPLASLVRAIMPSPDEIWETEEGQVVYRLIPLAARPGLTIDGSRIGEAVGDAWFTAEHELNYVLEQAVMCKPPHDDNDVWGWLLGRLGPGDGTILAAAREAGREGDDWMNLLTIMLEEWHDRFYDCALYLLVRQEDLSRADFSQVAVISGCGL